MFFQLLLFVVVVFVCVVYYVSFICVVDDLGILFLVLLQIVCVLEVCMGVCLLYWIICWVGLIEYGVCFLVWVCDGLVQIDVVFEDLDSVCDVLVGKLCINVLWIVVELLVLLYLFVFMVCYLQVEVELFVELVLVDLVVGGFDVGIWLGECLVWDMIVVLIGLLEWQVVVVMLGYFVVYGMLDMLVDLVGYVCIVYWCSNGCLMVWEFSYVGCDFEVEVSGWLVFNDVVLIYVVVCVGFGMGQVFDVVVVRDVVEGWLQVVLQDWQLLFVGFYLYYLVCEQMVLKLWVFIDYLCQV